MNIYDPLPERTFWVYGTPTCPYCDKAKELITSKGFCCVYIDIAEHPEWRLPEWKTVPQIFEVGKAVGGYAELEKLLEDQ
mgnify:CR=1 FL=1